MLASTSKNPGERGPNEGLDRLQNRKVLRFPHSCGCWAYLGSHYYFMTCGITTLEEVGEINCHPLPGELSPDISPNFSVTLYCKDSGLSSVSRLIQ
jgi:hypothetical protein